MNGGKYDKKIKTTIADVHCNTKTPTLSSESQQHYAIRVNTHKLKKRNIVIYNVIHTKIIVI